MNISKKKEVPAWRARGYLTQEEASLPPRDRLEKGPVAVVECPEKIPCDPCSEHCPADAIEMKGINEKPGIDFDQCSGCALCVQHCPGLAIFVLDCSSPGTCKITIPYELPLPEKGEEVEALSRKGEKVTTGIVQSITARQESAGDTPTATVEVPEKYAGTVRNIRRIK
ncbi:MAG: 4Fe-4S dicluster domain-containing protein [Candidatus Acetothermia bacterium]